MNIVIIYSPLCHIKTCMLNTKEEILKRNLEKKKFILHLFF